MRKFIFLHTGYRFQQIIPMLANLISHTLIQDKNWDIYTGCIGPHGTLLSRLTSLNIMTSQNVTVLSSQYGGCLWSKWLHYKKKEKHFQKWKLCKKNNLSWVWGQVEKSVPGITVWHHSASLVMPDSNPQDGLFYLPLMPMIRRLRFSTPPKGPGECQCIENHVRSLLMHKNWKHLLHFALFFALFCFAFSPMSRERNFHWLCSF